MAAVTWFYHIEIFHLSGIFYNDITVVFTNICRIKMVQFTKYSLSPTCIYGSQRRESTTAGSQKGIWINFTSLSYNFQTWVLPESHFPQMWKWGRMAESSHNHWVCATGGLSSLPDTWQALAPGTLLFGNLCIILATNTSTDRYVWPLSICARGGSRSQASWSLYLQQTDTLCVSLGSPLKL